MSIQYFHNDERKHNPHNECQSYTAVVDVPPLHELKFAIQEYVNGNQRELSIPAGLTLVHPKDQYCKATGRTEALSKCKTLLWVIKHIRFGFNRSEIELCCIDPSNQLGSIILELSPNRKKPHLIYVTIN